MRNLKRWINILVICIAILSIIASIAGLLINGGTGQYEFKSINGEIVNIYGKGLYMNDSISMVAQGKASDFITLILGIPLLSISLYFTNKESLRGKLMLTGTLGYFLYTYTSYTFLWMYNPFFIVYVALMSLSLYALIICFMSFDIETMPAKFSKKLPVKFLGGYQIFIGIVIGMLWLGKILPPIFGGATVVGLEHYTTLVIQGLDLGIVVPTSIISGILLIKRKPFGYLLSSVVIIKSFTMLTCISAMIINQALKGVSMNIVEVSIFPMFNILAIICLFLLMKNTNKSPKIIQLKS